MKMNAKPPPSDETSTATADAVILDMDGVVTQTAHLHASAWKQMFDRYLKQRAADNDEPFREFDADEDYRRYVDGRPRYEGVKTFLESRDIDLPYGDEDDPATKETICGLGNQKNEIFLKLVSERGVNVFDDAEEQIRRWRRSGLKTALVTSSRNGAKIIKESGLQGLFDARIDGVTANDLDLRGKPAPDTFLEAARRLDVEPSNAVLIEDAPAGVRAGVAGEFGTVVGVARDRDGAGLTEAGADIVVESLQELKLDGMASGGGLGTQREFSDLPGALDSFQEFTSRLKSKKPAFFLDFDGTLAPIVKRPEDAAMSNELRETLNQLARRYPVAIVSGRDRMDVEQKVGLLEAIYAGSHGMDISGPDGLEMTHLEATQKLTELDSAEQELRKRLDTTDGVQIERKRFAVAIHFRNARADREADIRAIVKQTRDNQKDLRLTGGKKVFELRPDIDWDKGRAVLWLLDALDEGRDKLAPLYIGDDLTDEDAFRALADAGVGVLVGDHGKTTAADFKLGSPSDVHELLERMVKQT
jgi:alpha,alpha-trehalase